MIKSIKFKNYKVLRNAELPLGRFNLLVRPNDSGKSTALEVFNVLARPRLLLFFLNHPPSLAWRSQNSSFIRGYCANWPTVCTA